MRTQNNVTLSRFDTDSLGSITSKWVKWEKEMKNKLTQRYIKEQ